MFKLVWTVITDVGGGGDLAVPQVGQSCSRGPVEWL